MSQIKVNLKPLTCKYHQSKSWQQIRDLNPERMKNFYNKCIKEQKIQMKNEQRSKEDREAGGQQAEEERPSTLSPGTWTWTQTLWQIGWTTAEWEKHSTTYPTSHGTGQALQNPGASPLPCVDTSVYS